MNTMSMRAGYVRRVDLLLALILTLPLLTGSACMARAIDRGLRAQEYAEDSPIFSSLPNDICTLAGNAPGMTA